jgi:AcrR family transcriptional regulator
MTNNASLLLIRDEMSEKIIKAAEEIALSDGSEKLTVRKILKRLGITNRVFYNRFRNISEVLGIIYKNVIQKMRDCISDKIDREGDFFEQVNTIISQIISTSYDTRMKIKGLVLENELILEENRKWWMEQISNLLNYAMSNHLIREVDVKKTSYSIWCFVRGYNADAAARNLSKEEAVDGFKYGFSCFLEGLKVN